MGPVLACQSMLDILDGSAYNISGRFRLIPVAESVKTSLNTIMPLYTRGIGNLNLVMMNNQHRPKNAECSTRFVSFLQHKVNQWILCLESTSKRSILWNIMLRSVILAMSTRPSCAISNVNLIRFGMKIDFSVGQDRCGSGAV